MRKCIAIIIAVVITVSFTVPASADDSYDLRTVSDLTAEEIKPYMHPSSRHLADEVIRICEDEEISAEFIVTLMRWEKRPDLHNWFGWTKNNGRLARFPSDIECLEFCIPAIKRMYLSEKGRYFNGYTVAAVSKYYNDSDFWRKTITTGMERVLNNDIG